MVGESVGSRVGEAKAFKEGRMMLNESHEDRKMSVGINREVAGQLAALV